MTFLRPTVLGFIVLALVGAPCVHAAQPVQAAPAPLALVRIALAGAADRARAAGAGLHLVAHLTGADGEEALLALVEEAGWPRLHALGRTWVVLDPQAAGASYYLIESRSPRAPAKDEDQLAALFVPLHDDGRQIVARLRAGVLLEAVDTLGRRVVRLSGAPLALQPAPRGQVAASAGYDPFVATLIAQVTPARVAEHVARLTGEQPILVGGRPYTLTTRYSYSGEPLAKATQSIYEHLQARGWAARYHEFWLGQTRLRNVIGEKRGRDFPDRIYILAAHLDSRAASAPHDPAPGADDNASGCAALLVAADLLARIELGYTVRLAFFTGEEQGMIGSEAYVHAVAAAQERILGVLNLDMIGWDAKYGPDIDLHSHLPHEVDDSDALAELFAAVVQVYGLHLNPQVVGNGTRFSDHGSFWARGYAAILAIEDYYNPSEVPAEPHDTTPHYHRTSDRLSTLNQTYMAEYTRAALGTLMHLARTPFTLRGEVRDATTRAALTGAHVTALGATVPLSATTDAVGLYALALPAGPYTVTATMAGYVAQTITDITVLTSPATILDFALQRQLGPGVRRWLPLLMKGAAIPPAPLPTVPPM